MARIVYLSFFNAAPDATFTLARDHWATEEHIRASGVTWTFLRMNLYMDFIPGMAVDGVIRGPAGDGRVSAILRDDVAAAAVAVLRAPRDGETFDLTGPSAFSLAEAAELLGVEYVDETDEEAFASRASYGAPDWEVAGWVSSYQAIRDGSLARVSDDVAPEALSRVAVSLTVAPPGDSAPELFPRVPASQTLGTTRAAVPAAPRCSCSPSPTRRSGPAPRARAFAASASRSLGGALVTSWSSRRCVACATSSTACSKAWALACDGFVEPLILRTYWSAASCTSFVVAGGSKLWS